MKFCLIGVFSHLGQPYDNNGNPSDRQGKRIETKTIQWHHLVLNIESRIPTTILIGYFLFIFYNQKRFYLFLSLKLCTNSSDQITFPIRSTDHRYLPGPRLFRPAN